jgi:predicted ester cyclase/uncharacterized protein YndB with AHSA1/START domain
MEIPMQEERNKQVVREFTRIFKNQHKVDGVSHLFDQDFVHHFRDPLPAGFEGFRQVGIMMNTAFPDVVVTEEDLIASGDRVIERSSAVATHKNSMMGEPPGQKRVAWTEIHIYRLNDGKIAEHWVEFSRMELLQQIGVMQQLGSKPVAGEASTVAIRHQITLDAAPEAAYAALATQAGLRRWWTADTSTDERVGGRAEFGFDHRSMVFHMDIDALEPGKRVVWTCHGDHPEWAGTVLTWNLSPEGNHTILRFVQSNWKAYSDFCAMCNSTWGELMYRLKDYVEGKNPGPHWKE